MITIFFSSEYADFLVDEFIPYIRKIFFELIGQSDMHMVSGGSSGGMSSMELRLV